MASMSLPAFIAKWAASATTEIAASQEHFIDLCRVLGQPTPNEADPKGESYAFQKSATKTTGRPGFADVWKRGYFAWEYKGKRANLAAAYQQLLTYREDLENPPLLVVCDLNRFEVHTNFTGTAKRVYAFDLADLQNPNPTPSRPAAPLEVLRALFTAPERLRPTRTTAQVTEDAAAEFAKLATSLQRRGVDPEQAAHFLMRVLFCLFSEDIALLPSRLFTRLVENARFRPADFSTPLRQLFQAMAHGGWFGGDVIEHFNGGLFATSDTLDLTSQDIEVLFEAVKLDWASIEPAIFGTLFERSLDPAKRAQLGAHYTSRNDILLIVEPVLMEPLRRRWAEVRQQAEELIAKRDAAIQVGPSRRQAVRRRRKESPPPHQQALERLLTGFQDQIAGVRVLDPACGSGNFLYVALKRLLDLEKEVITFAASSGMTMPIPQVGPEQLYGIEVNTYAHELAQVVVWIGYIQWLRDNGFGTPSSPILKPLHNIERMDALLAADTDGKLKEPTWPEADVIVGNPPFLGGKRLRTELGDDHVDRLFTLYAGRVPREADLVIYWFERTRAIMASGRVGRAGLLATQAIRRGANRRVLEHIKQSGDIFMAWSDRPWVLDGADVRVSMVGFDNGIEQRRVLDGLPVHVINVDLTGAVDLTVACRLRENLGLTFMGDTKGGSFDIPGDVARRMLDAPLNPNGRPNSDVVRPWANGLDITRRARGMWIIDFGTDMAEEEAALYDAAFAHVLEHVKPARAVSKTTRPEWWLHERPRPEMREALTRQRRYICTPRVARHRLFVWMPAETLPDSRLYVFAREDDYFFGVLHSRVHEVWALATSSRHGVGNDPTYNNTTCFETFPLPWAPGHEPLGNPLVGAIAEAARELVAKRDGWLNPPGATEAQLRGRTLTNLYNQRPPWLDHAHRKLDAAVLDAYGWLHTLSDQEILERLLALNLTRMPGGSQELPNQVSTARPSVRST